jgi:hypothetical protein
MAIIKALHRKRYEHCAGYGVWYASSCHCTANKDRWYSLVKEVRCSGTRTWADLGSPRAHDDQTSAQKSSQISQIYYDITIPLYE